jgi:hypothetical protein
MPTGIVCPIDGTRLTLASGTNTSGDRIHRWECPIGDWAGPWYSNIHSGENEPIPEVDRNVEYFTQTLTTLVSEMFNVDFVDDYDSLLAIHQTLTASTDTIFNFAQSVRTVRVSNWDSEQRVLVKDGVISNNSDITAARVGVAISNEVPSVMWFPFATDSIHLRSSVNAIVTVEGYIGSV